MRNAPGVVGLVTGVIQNRSIRRPAEQHDATVVSEHPLQGGRPPAGFAKAHVVAVRHEHETPAGGVRGRNRFPQLLLIDLDHFLDVAGLAGQVERRQLGELAEPRYGRETNPTISLTPCAATIAETIFGRPALAALAIGDEDYLYGRLLRRGSAVGRSGATRPTHVHNTRRQGDDHHVNRLGHAGVAPIDP